MGFTVRLTLGAVVVLLCLWSAHSTPEPITNNEDKSSEKLQKAENQAQNIVANLTEDSVKPKTDTSTEDNKTINKQNNVDKLQKSESYKKATAQPEIGRSIDIDKYISKEFHNKNNVFSLPLSPDTEKYVDPGFDFHGTTHKHFEDQLDYHSDLTTPKSAIFDHKYQEAVESVEQKLEHIDDDDSHEISLESESKESVNLEKLYEETQKNDTKADLNYINYKSIINNDTGSKNSLHKDLVVEAGTNLDFRSSHNHTTVIDEDDNGNNTVIKEPDNRKVESSTLSNLILSKGDLDHAESSTSKSIVLTTRKSINLTKPPSNKNSSHISILSNNIETETVKAINLMATTEKSKGESEIVSEVFPKTGPIEIVKRPFTVTDIPRTEATIDTNHINKKSEQLLQENQVIPVHVEPPDTLKRTTEFPQTTAKVQEEKTNTPSVIEVLTTKAPKRETTSEKPRASTTETALTTEKCTTTLNAHITETTTLKGEDTPATERVLITTTQIPEIITEKGKASTTPASVVEVLTTRKLVPPQVTEVSSESVTENVTETEAAVVTEAGTTLPPILEIQIEPEVISSTEETDTTTLPQKPVIKVEHEIITSTKGTETETITSVVTETSMSPWERATTEVTKAETETSETLTVTVLVPTTYLSDSTAATTAEPISTTDKKETTENAIRTSEEAVFNNVTQLISATTTEVNVATSEKTESTTEEATTQSATTTAETIVEHETTTISSVPGGPRILPDFKHIASVTPTEVENSTESHTSDFYEHTDSPDNDNSGIIAAITISSIAAVCLILVAGLLIIMRKRQKRFNYGQRCTPVSLDDYSMDNVSVYNTNASLRRKGLPRSSKRSYGNPAFEDPVCVSHPLNFPALGKFASNLEDIRAEFEEIPQITARTYELPEGCDTKNRYANVIPLPETRVFLSLIDGYPNSDYINANYVTGPKNTKGYYIACQAPLQNTVDDFWRMIWEQQCKVILMLTHLFENGVEKCVDYLPPSEVLDCHRLFGDFQVTLKKREVKDKYIISNLQLKNMVSNSWREVTHFWYMGWPEKGVPIEANSLIAFLIEARSYMKSSSLDRKDVTNGNLTNGMTKNELNPVVVHCSPGTGRTGVVIACDIAIREFEQNRLVDVPRIVYKIRRDRASAVQTKEQYAFIYKVINLYATKLTGGALDSL